MDRQSISNVVAFSRGATQAIQNGAVISKIESILENIIDALSENRVLAIPLRSRRSGNETLIRFPANTRAEVKRFTCVLQILHVSHEALVSGHVITKRNIYYQNPDLFGSQQYVDKLVDDISFTFGVGRDALSVVAAYKGLIAGNVIITLKSDSALDCSSDDNGTLIPHAEVIRHVGISGAKWILVIEKEATFRGLAASRYFETSAAGVGIIVTGKGYPDLVTRQFLHLLDSAFLQVPIYALVDFDPSGIDIMLTYKRGSRSLSHEENVTVPRLSWLGPRSCDILGHAHCEASPQEVQANLSGLPSGQQASPSPSLSGHTLSVNALEVSSHLTALDRRKAINLLTRVNSVNSQHPEEVELAQELQLMLMLNLKAEIQAVDDAGDMSRWLDEKLLGPSLSIEGS